MSSSLVQVVRNADRESNRRPLSMQLVSRLWGLLSVERSRRNILLAIVLIRGIQLPLLAWSIGAVINGPISRRDSLVAIIWAAAGILALAVFTQITMVFRQKLALQIGERIVHGLRRDVFEKFQQMPMSFYARNKTGRLISRISSDCEAVRVGVQDILFVSLIQIGQMVGAGLLMMWYDRVLFGCVLAMTPVTWAITHVMRRRLGGAYRDVQDSFARVTATIAESVAIIRVTQAMGREDLNSQSFGDLAADHAGYNMVIARQSGLLIPLLEWTGQLSLALIVAVGGYRAMLMADPMPVGDLIQFWFLAGLFFSPIQVLGTQYDAALAAMAGAERVFGVLDETPQWTDVSEPDELPSEVRGQIELCDVTFGYQTDAPILDNLSLKIAPRQTLALVGETGSGKSTLALLIARFYLPWRGQILIDGWDIRRLSQSTLADHIAVVHQQNYLFSGTVRENLVSGRPGISDERIREVFAVLDCRSVLQQLPHGLETPVGSKGEKLSLGQRQMICFARAMLGNPSIVILDEATSAVDSITELKIQRALNRLLAGRTAIIIAHRLSTIRSADRIIVMDRGQIIESGTHLELLQNNGAYANLNSRFSGHPPNPPHSL